jgi:transposase
MVELVRSGRKPSELSKEFGCHTTSILSWVRQAGGSGTALSQPSNATPLNAQERQELIELRRKLRQVQTERDILAKATAWFAGKSEKTFTPSTKSPLQNLCNPHKCWCFGVITDIHNSRFEFQ